MSDKSTNNDNIKNALESLESAATTPSNDAVTGVEVVKGDTVVYEDGDFEDYNADKDYEVDEETKSGKDDESNKDDQDDNSAKEDKHSTTIANIYQWASKLKDDFISDKKEAKSDEEDKSDSENEDKHEDKHSATIANIYQWAAKLKEDFTSEASNMTLDVSEKAVAIMLNRLLDVKTAELEAFDKKVADSEGSVDNAEEERSKIAEKKDKYQGMIDQLQG
ncbi:hypothetical protein PSYCG_06925 [Psychrobacter sp. G]|uniref:hypothetical protein n=1 Tax=Psychrobacter sp. G TaxID=571800 RepID=UPI000354A10F|nr:hypothetical protein [Psychrobacter sp. G]AGP48905.1 hypothetical protein PSYCG_06925 [Psychrobacter sp. G]